MAIRPGAVRNLLSRLGFIQAARRQLRASATFQQAASVLWGAFAHLGSTFNELQVALSSVRNLISGRLVGPVLNFPAASLVRDFPLNTAFGDVIGSQTRFVVGVNIDLERFTGGSLRGGQSRFMFEFRRPPSLQDIMDRIEAFRTFPGERRRYERLRNAAGDDFDFSAADVTFAFRLT